MDENEISWIKSVGIVLFWTFKRIFIPSLLLVFLFCLGNWSYSVDASEIDGRLANSIFDSVVVGFVGSLFFLLFQFSLRPSVKIASSICYHPIHKFYYFKMVNTSLLWAIVDVHVTVRTCTELDAVGEGKNIKAEILPLKSDVFNHVSSILGGRKNKKYAFLVRTDDEATLHDFLDKQHGYIELSVYCKHSFSGFSKLTSKLYKNPNCLHTGEFNTGVNTNVLQIKSAQKNDLKHS